MVEEVQFIGQFNGERSRQASAILAKEDEQAKLYAKAVGRHSGAQV
jgi:hypothetical protein